MGSEGDRNPSPTPESARRRRRSTPDEDGEAAAAVEGEDAEGSKRRKHHHHHHHHHRHHRHSSRHHHRRAHRDKRGREGDEGGDAGGGEDEEGELPPPSPVADAGAVFSGGLPVPPPPPLLLPGTAVATATDLYEREEGEIFEDEEVGCAGGENGGLLPMGGRDRVCEPGELLPDDAGSRHHLEIRMQEDHLSGEGSKDMALERSSLEGASPRSRSHGNIEDIVEYGRPTEYGITRLRSSSLLDENGNRVSEGKGLEREATTSSPISGESPSSTKETKRYGNGIIISDFSVETQRARRHSESRNAHGHSAEKRKRSLSPEGSKDKSKSRGRSPSYGKYQEEVYRRGRSTSRDHARERCQEQSTRSDADCADHANSFGTRDRVRADSDLERGSMHDKSYHHDNTDRMKGMESDRLAGRASERGSSHGRHDGHEERYGGRDGGRDREKDRRLDRDRDRERLRDTTREKERDRETMRDRVRADSDLERGSMHDKSYHHDNTDRMKGMESDRLASRASERDSSHGRHDGHEERYGSRDGGRDREKDRRLDRDRDRERLRDTTREKERDRETMRDRHRDREKSRDIDGEKERDSRYRDREKSRDIDRERERDRERARTRDIGRERERDGGGKERDSGRDRVRNQEIPRDRERDQVRQIEKDRARSRERHMESRHLRYDEKEHHRDRTRSKESTKEPGSRKLDHGVGKETSTRRKDEEEYKERIEQQLAVQEEEDPEKIIEESRRRRLAILEKYKQQRSQQPKELSSEDHAKEEKTHIADDTKPPTVGIEPSANADNGSLPDLAEDRHDATDVYMADQSFSLGKSPQQNGASAQGRVVGAGGLGEGSPKSEQSEDMFCDDIFGESPAGVRKPGKGDDLKFVRSGLHDNWDDAEGYYIYRFGEVLDNRYEVIASHGKGVFSTVVRAKDLKAGKGDPEEVAIKIIRNNETMYKAGLEELTILKKLVGADPDDKRHCVRFLSSFKYRNHLCLVFESLHMNLREVLKKFGRNIGLKLTAVRAYAKQLFIALKHLKNCGVLHCDIKPDNMLVNEAKNVLKLCDFGNAMFAGKNEITPYLVSRFYRAPEIILGLPYDHPMDMWSVGCCLYELYSGKVLFPGPTNNDMLRLHMELKGPFPKKMLRKGAFTDQHFDQDLNFHATEEDPVTKKVVKRLLFNIKPKDIGALITTFPGEDPKMLAHFKDLLERMFILDPEKRMTVAQALSHPFITGK